MQMMGLSDIWTRNDNPCTKAIKEIIKEVERFEHAKLVNILISKMIEKCHDASDKLKKINGEMAAKGKIFWIYNTLNPN